MKTFFYLLIITCGIACNIEKQYQPANVSPAVAINEPGELHDTAYMQALAIDTFQANIYGIEKGQRQELVILASYQGKVLSETHRSIEGKIVDSRIADLNSNQVPEIYVFYETATGDNVKVFEFRAADPSELFFPDDRQNAVKLRMDQHRITKELLNKPGTLSYFHLTAEGKFIEQNS